MDQIAVDLVERFMGSIRQHEGYRADQQTQSILTITSNVVYGKKTGTTPCGRQAGDPSRLVLIRCMDVTSWSFSFFKLSRKITVCLCSRRNFKHVLLSAKALGRQMDGRIASLVAVLDGYSLNTATI